MATNFTKEHFGKIQKLDMMIRMEAPFIDIKPYSHNIVGLYLKKMKELCEGTTYLDNILTATPLPIMGWKHLLSDSEILTDEMKERMKEQLKGWKEVACQAMCASESESESEEWEIFLDDGEEVLAFDKKEHMKDSFDFLVSEMKEFGKITNGMVVNRRPHKISCYGDLEAEDWYWRGVFHTDTESLFAEIH